ncbi:MAG TPA: four helix bundle protein [Chlamydiales bacterium]|nr:four helix bundle protein [Chlamydiales bacterium]
MKSENVGASPPHPVKGDLRDRTKKFAIRVVNLYTHLPKTMAAGMIGKQLLRSGTSAGAHLREAYRGRSKAEFVAKLDLTLQELDESLYWLELLMDTKLIPKNRLSSLYKEAEELVAIFTSVSKKTKAN